MFYIYSNDQLVYSTKSEDQRTFVLSPSLKEGMGKSGALEFTFFSTHPLYDQISRMLTYVKVYHDDELLFYGRVLNLDTDIYKQRKVYCEGCLSFINDTYMKKGTHKESVMAFFTRVINNHNSQSEDSNKLQVGDVLIDEKNKVVDFKIERASNTIDVLDNLLLDQFGGYLRIRYVDEVPYIDYVKEYGTESSQIIEFGKNVIDINQSSKGEDIFTVLVPLGKEGLTVSSANNGSDEMVIQDGVDLYGRIVKIEEFSDISTASELKNKAQEYIDDNFVLIPDEFDIKALDLSLVDPEYDHITLGDKVRILSYVHGYDIVRTCTKVEYNLQNPEETSYTFEDLTPGKLKGQRGTSLKGGGSGGEGGMSGFASGGDSFASKLANKINADETTLSLTSQYISVVGEVLDIQGSKSITLDTIDLKLNNHGETLISVFGGKDAEGKPLSYEDPNNPGMILYTGKSIVDISSDITSVRTLIAQEINAVKADIGWLEGKVVNADEFIARRFISSRQIYAGADGIGTEGDIYADGSMWVGTPHNDNHKVLNRADNDSRYIRQNIDNLSQIRSAGNVAYMVSLKVNGSTYASIVRMGNSNDINLII